MWIDTQAGSEVAPLGDLNYFHGAFVRVSQQEILLCLVLSSYFGISQGPLCIIACLDQDGFYLKSLW